MKLSDLTDPVIAVGVLFDVKLNRGQTRRLRELATISDSEVDGTGYQCGKTRMQFEFRRQMMRKSRPMSRKQHLRQRELQRRSGYGRLIPEEPSFY